MLGNRSPESPISGEARGGSGDHILAALAGFGRDQDPLLCAAAALYADCDEKSLPQVEEKRAHARGYDISNMRRAATICHWGRSGTVLFASFLDSHPEVLILPNQLSESIYPFLADFAELTLWQKLLIYPAYSATKKSTSGDFFLPDNPDGDYAISPAGYLAAVMALYREYGAISCDGTESRAGFFRFLHVAYALAQDRQAGHPRPMIIFAQHWWNELLAARFREDFPGAKFLHTVRDPISAVDAWLEMHFKWQLGGSGPVSRGYPYPVFDAYRDLLSWDLPHPGMSSNSRAVRFEDMHTEPDSLMCRVAHWLCIAEPGARITSTLNGRPYVVVIDAQRIVGSNPARAVRRSRNLGAFDRLLIFALLYRNFVDWRYPVPAVLRSPWLRALILLAGSMIPSRLEATNAAALLRRQCLPALKSGRIGYAGGTPFVILIRRGRIMWLILRAAAIRLAGHRRILQLV